MMPSASQKGSRTSVLIDTDGHVTSFVTIEEVRGALVEAARNQVELRLGKVPRGEPVVLPRQDGRIGVTWKGGLG